MSGDRAEWSSEILSKGRVTVRQDDRVLTVTLDRPEARNAQTPATWAALASIGEALASDPGDTAVVVIKGEGPTFSAGLDRRMFTAEGVPGEGSLADLVSLSDEGLDAAIAEFQRAFTWQREVPMLTVAAVQGHAIGAGFQLALACDLIIADSSASFAMRETALGLVPDLGGTHPLVRAVGVSRALDICATGRSVGATEAVGLGIVAQLVEDLDEGVAAYVQAITAAPPGAVADLLPLLRGADDRDAREQRAAERRAQIGRLRALTGGRS